MTDEPQNPEQDRPAEAPEGTVSEPGAAAPAAADDPGEPAPQPGIEPVQPVAFGALPPGTKGGDGRNLDLLLDVEIPISVEVGRTSLSLEDVLRLVPGSVVGLSKKVEEPVDLRVNGKLVARGEVVLVDDNYGLRITQILDHAGRIESLR